MSVLCIPKQFVETLKASAIKGEVDIKKLYDMDSEGRREFFVKHTNKELGKFLNTEFEKAMVSKKKTAYTDFVNAVYKPEARSTPEYKSMTEKINALDAMSISAKGEGAFLKDLVSSKLGLDVTPEVLSQLKVKSEKIDAALQSAGEELGSINKSKETLEFFKAKSEMDKYMQGLVPASNLKVLTSTIGRGMMLASVKSPVLNIGSNIEIGTAEVLARRIASGNIKTADNPTANKYVKMVNDIYQQTGYDVSRMIKLSDSGSGGARVMGDITHSQGKGAIRVTGRFFEDIVFKQLMGAPDVYASSIHFADSINLESMKLTKGDKAKAVEFMKDAMKLKPSTIEGKILRQQAILDAQVATWTDKTWASQVSEGIRGIFNKVSGDARVGDYLFPFIKTPANVVATGMDYAGMGIPKALISTVKAVRSGEFGSKQHLRDLSINLVRSGLGLTGAAIIAANLKDEDFVGAYDPSRAQIEELRNSNYNAIRIGNKWVSTAWLGPLAVPVSAMMFARQRGKTGPEKTFQYARGVLEQAGQIPGVSDVYDYVKASAYDKNKNLQEATGEAGEAVIDSISSRLIPGLLSDVARMTDEKNRVSKTAIEAVKSKVPGLRQTLPVKKNIFSEESKAENWFSTLLFGSRVKTDQEKGIIKEINTVATNTGKGIMFTNFDKTGSKVLAQFKEKVGVEKYNDAKDYYGKELKKQLEKTIASSAYNKMNDDSKLVELNKLDTEVIDKTYRIYKFKYRKPK